MNQINTINAINAYNKAQKTNTGSQAQFETQWKNLNVLRLGDQIDVVDNSASRPSFGEVLTAAMEPEIKKVQRAEVATKSAFSITPNGSVQGPDLVGMISALNEASSALDLGINARDRMLNAWMEIFKMPI